jgi:hypothetical protein
MNCTQSRVIRDAASEIRSRVRSSRLQGVAAACRVSSTRMRIRSHQGFFALVDGLCLSLLSIWPWQRRRPAEIPCLRHTSAVLAPASCSFSIPIICSSVNREDRIVRLHDRRTLPKSGRSSGSQVHPLPYLIKDASRSARSCKLQLVLTYRHAIVEQTFYRL